MLKPKHLIVLTQIIMLFACDTTETNTRKVTPGNKPNIEILQITPPVKSNLKITDTITIKCKFELKDIEPGNEYEIEMVFEPENYIYEGLASTLAYIGLGYPGAIYNDIVKTGTATLRCPVSLIAKKDDIKKKPLRIMLEALSVGGKEDGTGQIWINGYSDVISYDNGI